MSRPNSLFLLVLLSFCQLCVAQTPSKIRMDGEFDDWQQSQLSGKDPVGDATAAFDVSRVDLIADGTTLYVRFDTQQPLNLQSGLPAEGTLRLRVEFSDDRKLLVDFRERSAILNTPGSSNTIPWSELRFSCLPTYAAKEFELRLDLKAVGAGRGETMSLNFEGSDSLSDSLDLTIGSASPRTQADASTLAKPSGALRVASINTLHEGSATERAPSIKKLLDFAKADVYCFNEVWEEDVFRETIGNVLPDSLRSTANLHWANTCGIVSRFPVTPLSFECPEAAALIETPDGANLVVVAVHFKCCGYRESREDQKRVEEVNALLADLKNMRAGKFGPNAARAGVIVLGDYNLVGSRKPLDLLNQFGIEDLMMRNPIDGSANTWRGMKLTESFWPGRLDYASVDTKRIGSASGFLLNTEQLNEIDPRFATDVIASDHSMMVVDLELQKPE